jgi:hypothetical protein
VLDRKRRIKGNDAAVYLGAGEQQKVELIGHVTDIDKLRTQPICSSKHAEASSRFVCEYVS